jgi:hypothetical protein
VEYRAIPNEREMAGDMQNLHLQVKAIFSRAMPLGDEYA